METRNWKLETGDRRPEKRNKSQDARNKKKRNREIERRGVVFAFRISQFEFFSFLICDIILFLKSARTFPLKFIRNHLSHFIVFRVTLTIHSMNVSGGVDRDGSSGREN